MYTIAGATGRVGSVTAARLLAEGERVRVLVRDATKATALADAGADITVVDLRDRHALAEAITDSRGLFSLLPFDLSAADFHADTRAMVTSIAGAVADSGVPHVVALSSWGADLPAGTGPIVGLHHFEAQLRTAGAVVTSLRSGHFQEKVSDVLDPAHHTGVYPVFAASADVPKPMVATRDIGELAAQTLRSTPTTNEIIDVTGPAYTERQVADALAAILGRPLEVVTVPEPAWTDALVQAGLSANIAEVLTGLYRADERGLLAPRGDRIVRGTTEIETTLSELVGASVADTTAS